ncbi:MAG: hypothetical protein BMS9Abin32_161 [Gammaproteobacteria bacterium]|nr:MAG: hypothetical protein BMS9Abin32_161 [Gammaproteobacteria bacterium]
MPKGYSVKYTLPEDMVLELSLPPTSGGPDKPVATHKDGRPIHSRACFASHMGIYAIEPTVGAAMAKAVANGTLQAADHDEREPREDETFVIRNGVAIIKITGALMKGVSKFADTSTANIRRVLAQAMQHPEARGIMLVIESPGGSVSGTDQLALDIRAANDLKPVHTHFEDLGASAALWVGVQAGTVTANRMADVGSIGAFIVVEDLSAMAAQQGIKVHVISSGKLKGAGVPGTEISGELLEFLQERVDEVTESFINAVAEGRDLDVEDVREIATGEMFNAAQAFDLGLIDGVLELEDALQVMAESLDETTAGEPAAKIVKNNLDKLTAKMSLTDRPVGEDVMDPKEIKAFLASDKGSDLAAELADQAVEKAVAAGTVIPAANVLEGEAAAAAVAADKPEDRAVVRVGTVKSMMDGASEATKAETEENAAVEKEAAALSELSGGTLKAAHYAKEIRSAAPEARADRIRALKAEAQNLALKNGAAASDHTSEDSQLLTDFEAACARDGGKGMGDVSTPEKKAAALASFKDARAARRSAD